MNTHARDILHDTYMTPTSTEREGTTPVEVGQKGHIWDGGMPLCTSHPWRMFIVVPDDDRDLPLYQSTAAWHGQLLTPTLLLLHRVFHIQSRGCRRGDSPESMGRDVRLKRKARIRNIVYYLNVDGAREQRRVAGVWRGRDALAVSSGSRDWGLVILHMALNSGGASYSGLSTSSSPSYKTSFDF
ncbi:hypothetical protein NLJ89_g9167 [Agrocybe chaxingu]|uniref:Uncharacterized protein n=1 Tax=Agrocybe chaxingu TaxID=84603 RepID=A0A9W8JT90_9AGAR|nr:hypothetical protein NLJ89_g9167 [Agrocybe chaxingu]